MATEILCSRCGTPFPQEREKASVTCVVCGQLRPDLDMTLDDDDDVAEAFDSGTAEASARPAGAVSAEAPARSASHLLISNDPPQAAPPRHYVSMNEDLSARQDKGPSDSLTYRIGPVLLVATPLAAGMAGALNMLALVPDFAKGSWYAVGAVFLAVFLGSLFAGLITSGIVYTLRLRSKLVLRVLFVAGAATFAFFGVRNGPSHVQVRDNELPGIMLRH